MMTFLLFTPTNKRWLGWRKTENPPREGWQGGGGLATAFDLAAFRLSMIAPVKKSVNHSRTVASMRETEWEQQQHQKFVLAEIRRCEVNSLLVGPVGHCFLCCNRFFFRSNVGLTFSWLLVLRLSFYMRFTALRTRPVNIHCTCTCSSMPDLLAHYWLSSCVSV